MHEVRVVKKCECGMEFFKYTVSELEISKKIWKDIGVNPLRPDYKPVAKKKKKKQKDNKIEKECRECGAIYMGTPGRVYCNNPCKGGDYIGNPIPRKDCVMCGKNFQPKSNRGKFCNNPCTYYEYKHPKKEGEI